MNSESINSVILVLERPFGTRHKASGKVLELNKLKTRGENVFHKIQTVLTHSFQISFPNITNSNKNYLLPECLEVNRAKHFLVTLK